MKALTTYLESLLIPSGRWANTPFKVLPWQKRFVSATFKPNVKTSSLSVARGNGKSALVAGIAAAAVDPDGPLQYGRADVVCAASSFDQSRVIFEDVLSYVSSKHDIRDKECWRVQDSANRATLEYLLTGTRVRCIGSDPRKAHGLRPALILADEPAQWDPSKADRMRAALDTGLGKVPGSRLIALGTRPADDAHWFAKMLAGESDYAQSHEAQTGDPKFQKRTWLKANPSLRHMPDLEAAIRNESRQAKVDPMLLASFDALRLNLGTMDVEASLLLQAGTWTACEGDADRQGPVVWGIDLGGSAAQSAIAGYWPETGRLETFAAFPSTPSFAERGLRDGCGNLYVTCAQRGELIQSGTNAVDVSALLAESLRRFGRPIRIVSDRWRDAELKDALIASDVPFTALELRGQGFKDGGEDVRAFRRAVADGRVTPVPSLLLRSAMSEARTVADPAGNSKLSKNTQGGRRLRARDDAAAAAILAVSAGVRQPARPRPRWRYAGMVG